MSFRLKKRCDHEVAVTWQQPFLGTYRFARGVAHHSINPSNTGDIEEGTYVPQLCLSAAWLGERDLWIRDLEAQQQFRVF